MRVRGSEVQGRLQEEQQNYNISQALGIHEGLPKSSSWDLHFF